MRHHHGYAVVAGPWGEIREIDTVQCGHCGRHTHLKPGEPPYATCRSCMQFVCKHCDHEMSVLGKPCKTQEKWLEEQERKITVAVERGRRVEEYRRLSG